MIPDSLKLALQATFRNGYGERLAKGTVRSLRASVRTPVAKWYFEALHEYPLCRSAWGYPIGSDVALLQWATPSEMLFETYDVMPGMDVNHLGYFAVAVSVDASDGDLENPYFVKFEKERDDIELVRIRRQTLSISNGKCVTGVELIAKNLIEFFDKARAISIEPKDLRLSKKLKRPTGYD